MNEQELKIAEKIKELLCESLGIEADVLTNEIPLFGDGIGLASIDFAAVSMIRIPPEGGIYINNSPPTRSADRRSLR